MPSQLFLKSNAKTLRLLHFLVEADDEPVELAGALFFPQSSLAAAFSNLASLSPQALQSVCTNNNMLHVN
jgi:hypothetical protein